jgi:hypothetical protein
MTKMAEIFLFQEKQSNRSLDGCDPPAASHLSKMEAHSSILALIAAMILRYRGRQAE